MVVGVRRRIAGIRRFFLGILETGDTGGALFSQVVFQTLMFKV